MLESMVELDRALFMLINVKLANPVTDFVMPLVTSDFLLRSCYAAAMVLLLWKGDARLRWLVLFSAVALTVSDQVSAGLLKPWIGRLRPCHLLENINLLTSCGGGNSMPSSHAANAFGQAVLFGYLYRVVRWPLIGLAVLVALSRVFVGVHYPGDILAGALLGVLGGLLLAWLFRRFVLSYAERDRRR